MRPFFAVTYVHVFVVWKFTRLESFFWNSIWWGPLSSNVFTICAVYWSLGRRGYFGVSNVVLVQYYSYMPKICFKNCRICMFSIELGSHIFVSVLIIYLRMTFDLVWYWSFYHIANRLGYTSIFWSTDCHQMAFDVPFLQVLNFIALNKMVTRQIWGMW